MIILKKRLKNANNFLIKHKIGVCDIVESCERSKIDASDLGMKNIKLRNLMGYLKIIQILTPYYLLAETVKTDPNIFLENTLKNLD